MDPESDLIARARRGDVQSFGGLVERYKERAYVVALGLVGNRDDAMDLSQDAFVLAFRAMRSFREGQAFYPWFYAILRNVCFNFLRGANVRRETSLDEARARGFDVEDPTSDPVGDLERDEMRVLISRELRMLDPPHREILVLRHFESLSYKDMAEVLGCPVGTVMSRLYAARRALAARLSRYLGTSGDPGGASRGGPDTVRRARRGETGEGGGS